MKATNGAMLINKQSAFFVVTYSIVYVNNFGVRLKEKSCVEVNWIRQPQEQLVLLVRWVGNLLLSCHVSRRAEGGYLQKRWVGVCDPLPKTLTLFMTKICVFCYPIYDLTNNSIAYLWRCDWHSCSKHKLWRAFVDGPIDNDEKVASSKKHAQFKTRVLKPYPIYVFCPVESLNRWFKR